MASWVVPDTGELLNTEATNAFTFLGAVCFFAGAWLMSRHASSRRGRSARPGRARCGLGLASRSEAEAIRLAPNRRRRARRRRPRATAGVWSSRSCRTSAPRRTLTTGLTTDTDATEATSGPLRARAAGCRSRSGRRGHHPELPGPRGAADARRRGGSRRPASSAWPRAVEHAGGRPEDGRLAARAPAPTKRSSGADCARTRRRRASRRRRVVDAAAGSPTLAKTTSPATTTPPRM